jgi:hypothetical protein
LQEDSDAVTKDCSGIIETNSYGNEAAKKKSMGSHWPLNQRKKPHYFEVL